MSLPEGIRLLSVFLKSDEYEQLIRCRGSSDVRHIKHITSSAGVKPSQPVRDSCSNRDDADDVKDDEGTAVADVGGDAFDSGNTVAGRVDDDVEHLIRQQGQHAVTQYATAIDKSSVVSDDFSHGACRSSDGRATAETSISVVTTVEIETVSSTNDDVISATARVPTDASCACSKSTQLVPLELYVQGNSQTVFLLFMEQGSLSELDVVKDLVQILHFVYCVVDSAFYYYRLAQKKNHASFHSSCKYHL